jgi:hypothetical protein
MLAYPEPLNTGSIFLRILFAARRPVVAAASLNASSISFSLSSALASLSSSALSESTIDRGCLPDKYGLASER